MIEITRDNIRIDKDFELNRWWEPVSIKVVWSGVKQWRCAY